MMRGKAREVELDQIQKDLINQNKGFDIYPERNEELQFKEI